MPNKKKRKRGIETEQSKYLFYFLIMLKYILIFLLIFLDYLRYDAPPTSDKISDIPKNFKRLLLANKFKKKQVNSSEMNKDNSQVILKY